MLLLGVDEGTTGVKAALFDERLRPVREARRDKVNRHPKPGWVEQDGEEVLQASSERSASCSKPPTRRSSPAASTTRASRCSPWDAETGAPLSPIVVWQDKRSQEVLDRMGDARGGDPVAQRPPLRPLLLGGEARLAARERRGGTSARATPGRCGWAPSTRSCATGSAPGFATDNSTASRTQLHRLGTPGFDARLCELFGVPPEVLPEVRDTAGELGTLRHESWPAELRLCGQVVDQQAALAARAASRRAG